MGVSLAHDVNGASSRRHFRRVRQSMNGLVRDKRTLWEGCRVTGTHLPRLIGISPVVGLEESITEVGYRFVYQIPSSVSFYAVEAYGFFEAAEGGNRFLNAAKLFVNQ